MDKIDGMEDAALRHAAEATDPNIQLRYLEIAKVLGERRKDISEAKKDEFEAQNAAIESRFVRTRFWASTVTPILALVVTGITFVVTVRTQSKQFAFTAATQAEQFQKTAEFQRDTNEDSQWKDALGKVSFKDSESALVGAFGMEGFGRNKRYQEQARSIAAASLPLVRNVAAFDQIVAVIENDSTNQNQSDLIEISEMVSFAQRARHGIVHAAAGKGSRLPSFLEYDILSIDMDPTVMARMDPQGTKVAAWELDTVSHHLRTLWNNPQHKAEPSEQNLAAVVLENDDFSGLNFSQADLSAAVLYRASFKNSTFRAANFKNVLVQDVLLDDADLSRVVSVDGSVWQGTTNWWDAKCVSPELLEYLVRTDPPPNSKIPKTSCP